MDVFIIILLATVALNVIVYVWGYFVWRKDCKEIGKERLSVSLGERMIGVYLGVTLPCIIAFIIVTLPCIIAFIIGGK